MSYAQTRENRSTKEEIEKQRDATNSERSSNS